MKKRIILLVLLLSIFMIGAVSASSDTNNIVSSKLTNNAQKHTSTKQVDKASNEVVKSGSGSLVNPSKGSSTTYKSRSNPKDTTIGDSGANNEEIIYTGDFEGLSGDIGAVEEGETLNLTKNYKYESGSTDGITITKSINIDGKGHTINGAGVARIFNITANNVTLKNINFIKGSSNFGGAITSENNKLTIINCNFTNNKLNISDGDGGAINFEGDILTISNSKFTDNTANEGSSGAILFEGNILNIIQSEFNNNSAKYEGAIFAYGTNITIYESIFKNNKAWQGIVGISADSSLIDNCDFINNSAEVYVAVSNHDGIMTINNSYFANNTAEKSTRVIRNSLNAEMIISNCIFENNKGNEGNYSIDNNYGTIYLHNNTINTQTSEIHNYGGNILSTCTATVLENKTIRVKLGEKTNLTAVIRDDNGNLIEECYYVYFKINDELIESTYNPETNKYELEHTFNTPGLVTINLNCPSINITVKQGTCNVILHSYVDLVNELDNCPTNTLELTRDYSYDYINDSSYEDGIIIDKSDFTIDGKGHTISGAGLARIFKITANNVTLKNINFINGSSNFGGAITSENNKLTIINCNFTNNRAQNGGAVYFKNGSLYLINSQFNKNNANVNNFGYGGAIYSENSTNIFDKSSFRQNTAFKGGAIKIRNDTGAIITSCVFISNSAYSVGEGSEWNESASGGAIYASINLNLKIIDSQFIENTVDSPNAYGGGAIYANGNLTVDKSVFDKNIATSQNDLSLGSAIFAGGNNTQILVNNTKINNGESKRASVYIWRSNTIIANTSFTNNKATENGGALHYYNGNAESTVLTLINSVFTGNTANNGGALYIRNSVANIINTTFTKNNAQCGGAIYTEDGKLNINNSQFVENSAYEGGVIFNEESGLIVIENTQFTQNTATYGGAINNNGKTSIKDTQFTQNTAAYGGAINNKGTTTIKDTQFTQNTAAYGGAIETQNNMTLKNTEFLANGENCIDIKSGAKLNLNNVTSDVPLVNDIITMKILEAKDVVYDNNVKIKVQVNSSAISSLNIGKVVVKVNNVEYSANIKNGIGTIIIPKLNAGNYKINVKYIDHNLPKAEIPVNFTVKTKNIKINAKNATYIINYDGTYKVSFVNANDGDTVTFTLNNKKIGTSTIKKGIASIKLTKKILTTAKAGKKNIIIKINNANYTPTSKTAKITINKENTKLTAPKITTTYNINKKLVITLKDKQNKPITNTQITVKLGTNTKKYKTNKKGQITIPTQKLTPKTYKTKIIFKGNNNYLKSSTTTKITIKKATPKITAKNKKFNKKVKIKKYPIKLNNNIKQAIKTAPVTLKINGKKYKVKTNNKGIATFPIKNLNKKGTYKATITYKGNKNYNKTTKKVKITVK